MSDLLIQKSRQTGLTMVMTQVQARTAGVRPDHSPAPFRLESFPPGYGLKGGHLVKDRLGDSIASLAWCTGDHPVAEQLANAMLFRASAALLVAAKEVLPLIVRELERTLHDFCELDADGEPKIETVEAEIRPYVEELVRVEELLVAAILLAEGD